MPMLSKSELNNLVGQSYKTATFTKSITESQRLERAYKTQKYDIFLSHSYLDRETILQLNYLLEEIFGLDVYVDWIENPDLDRSKVTANTAAQLRDAMNRSASLVYAISANASGSKWMPWELGYSDARHGRVAVLPIVEYSVSALAYQSQEFVQLYPHVDITTDLRGNKALWVNDQEDELKYASLKTWRHGGELIRHSR